MCYTQPPSKYSPSASASTVSEYIPESLLDKMVFIAAVTASSTLDAILKQRILKTLPQDTLLSHRTPSATTAMLLLVISPNAGRI